MKRRMIVVAIVAFLMLFMACNPETPVQYHKVNYIGIDGNIMVTHEVESGKTDTPPESPTRKGYEFIGWSLIKDGKETFDFKTPVTSEITLYPVWKINSYKVTFVYGEDVVYSSSEISVGYGSSIPPQDVKRDGYALKGWSTKEDGSEPYNLVTGEVTLYPIWGKTCTINYICDEDVVGTPGDVTVDIYTVVEAPENPTKSGYDFKGWKTDLESEDFFSFGSITSDVTLYPVFEGMEMTVNFLYEDKESLASKTYRTGDLLTPSSLGIGLDDSIFTWKLYDVTTEKQYSVDSPLTYRESGYTFEAKISSSLLTVEEGAISGSEDLSKKEGSYTLFIPRYLDGKEVTAIKDNAFNYKGNYSFDKLILPVTLTSIGTNAFYRCKNLSEVTIPSSVKTIGIQAFCNCLKLEKLTIEEGVEKIEDGAFTSCKSLVDIKLPSSLKTIGAYAFQDCSGLESITLPENITVIPEGCFSYCFKLTSISFKGTIEEIGTAAFSDCEALTSFPITDNVKKIGTYAFFNCKSLKEVTLPNNDSFTELSNNIFGNCTSLTSILIPNSVKTIGGYAFFRCSGITSIVIPKSVTSVGEYAFSETNITSITIPEGVNTIGASAFRNCSRLTEITINGAIEIIQDYTFASCTSLSSITIPNSIKTIGVAAFWDCSILQSVSIGTDVETISNSAFKACNSLEEITIPGNVRSIGNYAFQECTKLKTVVLNNGLEKIGSDAFSGCSSLVTITIPSTVENIGNDAFYHCIKLSKISVEKTVGTISGDPWGGNVFWNNETNQKETKPVFSLEWKTE
ncbi:MAG: leucine-rich repeat protein [Candidatus Ornithospirochaeta sp.]